MALYKYPEHLTKTDDAAFDQINEPGTQAPHAGIYRCVACGHEIGIAQSHTLPPQNHHQHNPGVGRIRWQLLVYAQHNK
jgi:hypothetical protein